MIWGGADVVIEIKRTTKCNALESSSWSQPLHPQSVEKLSSMKLVPGAKKVGGCGSTEQKRRFVFLFVFFFLHFNSFSRNTTHLVSRGLRKKEEVVGRFIWVRLTRIFTAPNFEEIFVFLKSLFCFPCRQALESKSIALQLLQRQTFLMRSPWIQVYHEEALEWARRTPCVR